MKETKIENLKFESLKEEELKNIKGGGPGYWARMGLYHGFFGKCEGDHTTKAAAQ